MRLSRRFHVCTLLASLVTPGLLLGGGQKSALRTTQHEGLLTKRPAAAQALDATIDIFDDVAGRSRSRPTERNIEEMMCQLRRLGIRRLYWLESPEFRNTACSLRDDGNGREALRHAVRAAHDAGLEFYATFKPFETGGTMRVVPHIVPLPPGTCSGESLIGPNYRIARFVLDHPQFRMRRRPLDLREKEPVVAIRLWANDDAPTRIGAKDIEVWTSPINGHFVRYEGSFEFADEVKERNGVRARTLTLSGLAIPPEQRYVLVKSLRREAGGTFRNEVSRFMEFLGRDARPIPNTGDLNALTRPEVELQQHYMWLCHRGTWGIPKEAQLAADYGRSPEQTSFRFDLSHYPKRSPDNTRALDGGKLHDGYAAAVRGVTTALNILQPMYPEVRAYWMDQVAALVESGVDGIDFRVDNHSAWVTEPMEFGFDPPVVAAYRERYGVDILTGPFDRQKLKALQGDAYTEFYRQARAYTRERGVRMQVHVNALMGDNVIPGWHPNAVPYTVECQWRGWIKEDLADSVLLKLLPWKWGSRAGMGSQFAMEIAELANRHGKPVSWEARIDFPSLIASPTTGVRRFTQDEIDKVVKEMQWGWNRPEIAAVVLYEVCSFVYMDPRTGRSYRSPVLEKLLEAMRAGTPISADALPNNQPSEEPNNPCAGIRRR